MVCLATLAPAATAADATGFALLKRYLDGREPALPEGCVLDVELEAKELLKLVLPAGRAAVEEAYRGMRAELGRRPTPTELFHAHYLPHTLRATHGRWFGFCRAEVDLDASEERAACDSGEWELSCFAGTRLRNNRWTTVMTEVDKGKPLQSQVRKLAALRGVLPSCGIVVCAAHLSVAVPAVGHF